MSKKFRKKFKSNPIPNKKTRTKAEMELLMRLTGRFGLRCWYCGIDLRTQQIHLDHIVPLSTRLPFVNDEENRALSCGFCNMAKRDYPLEVFLGWLEWVRSGGSFTPYNMTPRQVEDAAYSSRGGNSYRLRVETPI